MYNKTLPKEDYLPFAPKYNGQIKIAHQNCDNGIDHKKRLYIKKEGTHVVAFCHNCQKKGYYSLNKTLLNIHDLKALLSEVQDKDLEENLTPKEQLPDDLVGIDSPLVPLFFLEWFQKARLYNPHSSGRSKWKVGSYYPIFKYSPSQDVIYILYYDSVGSNLIYWQARQPPYSSSKYISAKLKKGEERPLFIANYNTNKGRVLVITEDVLSAIRINRDVGAISIALAGVSSPISSLLKVISNYNFEKIVVFLDGDNPTVKKAGADLVKALIPFVNAVQLYLPIGGKDPKEHTNIELRAIITDADPTES